MKRVTHMMNIFLILIPALILAGMLIVSKRSSKLLLFPDPDVRAHLFSDSDSGGNSLIMKHPFPKEGILFSYTLSDSFDNPYVGISFFSHPVFDISNYSHIKFDISASEAGPFQCNIPTEIRGYSYQSQEKSWLYHKYEIPVMKDRHEYSFALNSYTIPEWWFEFNNLSNRNPETDFSRTHSISLLTTSHHTTGIKNIIQIHSISLYRKVENEVMCLHISFLLYLIYIALYLRISSAPTKSHKKLYSDKIIEQQKLIDVIGSHFVDPNLSLKKIHSLTGIPSHRISAHIKRLYGLTYPQYLQRIRIAEGKRLLHGTDMKIIEIASCLGYGTREHFIRSFKKQTSMTPREYRKQKNLKKKKN